MNPFDRIRSRRLTTQLTLGLAAAAALAFTALASAPAASADPWHPAGAEGVAVTPTTLDGRPNLKVEYLSNSNRPDLKGGYATFRIKNQSSFTARQVLVLRDVVVFRDAPESDYYYTDYRDDPTTHGVENIGDIAGGQHRDLQLFCKNDTKPLHCAGIFLTAFSKFGEHDASDNQAGYWINWVLEHNS